MLAFSIWTIASFKYNEKEIFHKKIREKQVVNGLLCKSWFGSLGVDTWMSTIGLELAVEWSVRVLRRVPREPVEIENCGD